MSTKGVVYKITNTIDDEIYVGSTEQELQTRMNGHLSCLAQVHKYSLLYKKMNDF